MSASLCCMIIRLHGLFTHYTVSILYSA